MNTKLKLQIEEAINKVIEKNCEEQMWPGMIHDTLAEQMTNAAAQVFDSSMDGQKYLEDNP